jgi:RNA polymerase sigma-70 factor (ECF subfamily)
MSKATHECDLIHDKEFIERLYTENRQIVYSVVSRRLSDKTRIDDVIQDVFFTALSRAADLRVHPNHAGWLVQTAKNIVKQYNHQMKIAREIPFAEINMLNIGSADDVYHDEEEDIFAGLSPSDREILDMHYRREMSVREIANTLRIKEGAVKTRLSRARKRLMKLMGK